MAAKAIHEVVGKHLLTKHLGEGAAIASQAVGITSTTDWDVVLTENPWLLTMPLVVKPDQLIKRRGKLGLLKVNTDIDGVRGWIDERMGKTVHVGAAVGVLNQFIVEPYVAHNQADEYYVSIYSSRSCDTILFYHEGGIDIGDVDAKALRLDVPVGEPNIELDQVMKLLVQVPEQRRDQLCQFILGLYKVYVTLNFTYLEINPLVMVGSSIYVLDLAAKLDQAAEFECSTMWGDIVFPPPFGREALPEEAYIANLDSKTGASLKLTVLNKDGRIWTMVAGGGASVVYSDTICDLGGASELANYGEYSGAPSEAQTYEYAKTILRLMTRTKDERGKVLIVGGGIANFTNVGATFKGIKRALIAYKPELIEFGIRVYVRRGGPNFQEGLRVMEELGETLGVPIYVFGPETHMTAIVSMALGLRDPEASNENSAVTAEGGNTRMRSQISRIPSSGSGIYSKQQLPTTKESKERDAEKPVAVTLNGELPAFHFNTQAIVWGMQPRAVQGMLDFDYSCRRSTPSVSAMVYPFSGNHQQRFYWGAKEILIPIFKEMSDAIKNHPAADVLINFASLRSAYKSTMETLEFPQIRTIAIIAEGIPENRTRMMIKAASTKGVSVIGPATVGGIKPGCFKIGNTGGMLDNIISSKLYRPGSVAYVSRSGGMSNELNNIISRHTDGVYEGVAIGGDRYPGSTFLDHLLRFEADTNIKMVVLLGEVGGIEEYDVCKALGDKRLSKPMIAWCIGTCASMFTSEVQFGHAGSCAQGEMETSIAKNKALSAAGAHVPANFDQLDSTIRHVYEDLVHSGTIVPLAEPEPPTVPVDYSWAQELGLIRKPTTFMSTIVDERGEELVYAGMPLSAIFAEDLGIGGVLSLIWFKRRLPPYCCKFIEMCLMITADHGPAVSGAHNTIVCARAGKDLVSSLASGLLTIGPRFGGALDEAAEMFSNAYDAGLSPMEFVNKMRNDGKLIMGIGHRVKSVNSPDMRVTIVKNFCHQNFPSNDLLDYALKVEQITTSKKPNLILNVDGCMAVCFVDLLRNCGCFSETEALEYIQIGTLNGLFVLGRSLGFIGHYLDQKRLKQGLYRHPTDDISYVLPGSNSNSL